MGVIQTLWDEQLHGAVNDMVQYGDTVFEYMLVIQASVQQYSL